MGRSGHSRLQAEPRDGGREVQMTRVAAVVYNSVSHDARVLREADSLRDAGYEVRIVGIRDARQAAPVERRPSGVEIVRVAWRARAERGRAWLYTVVALLAGGLAWWFLAVAGARAVAALVDTPRDAIQAIWALVVGLGLIGFVWGPVRRAWRRAAAYQDAEGGRARPAGGPAVSAVLAGLVRRLGRLREAALGFGDFLQRLLRLRFIRRAVLAELRAFGPDVVHCHDLPTVAVGVAYARESRAKVVYDSHEIFEEMGHRDPWSKPFYRYIQGRLSRRVDAFVTINDSIADYLRSHYPHLPPAVIVKNAARRSRDRGAYDGRLHAAAGLSQADRILLYQGGFARSRGLEPLVRSGPLLPVGWHVVMMGWGSFEDALRRVAAEVDRDGARVHFLPPVKQEELLAWTQGAAVGIIPYENTSLNHWFCTPNKLWEYPLAGVPMLVSPFPELRQVVEQHGVGWPLEDPLTPEGIARRLASLSDSDLQRAREACVRYGERDNWSIYEKRLVALYRDLSLALSAAKAKAEPVSG